jgi:hypothetical protein
MGAHAFKFKTDNPDLSVRWDNTLKYNLTMRAQDVDKEIVGERGALAVLGDDADLGWKQGDIVSNRVDVLSEMDFIWKNIGFRASGAAWYDHGYSGGTGHPGFNKYLEQTSPNYADTWGSTAVRPGKLTDDAKEVSYRNIELLDAFIFGNFDFGESMGASVRAGRHTIYWGNSLLLAGAVHGIAGSMTTIDAAKGLSIPGTEAKELFRPTNKISGTFQINPNLSLVGYYSLQFEEYLLPPTGTYFSTAEGLTSDNDQFITLIPGQIDPQTRDLLSPRSGFSKTSNKTPGAGEWGAGLKYYFEESGWDLGVYFLNYYDKVPQGLNGALDLGQFASAQAAGGDALFQQLVDAWPLFNNGVAANSPEVFTGGGYPAIGVGNYNWVYKEDNQLFGLSLANEVWGISWGSDFVYRKDAPINTSLNAQLLHVSNIPADFPSEINGLLDAALTAQGFTYDNWDYTGQNSSNYPGATGDTWHVVINGVGFLPPTSFWDGGSYAVETTFSSLISVSDNEELLAPNVNEGDVTSTIAVNISPTWYQVLPATDLRVPISLSYTISGDAPPIAFGGTKEYGNASIALRFDYDQAWQADLRYAFNFGPVDGLSGNTTDRGNLSFTVKRTF